MIVDAHRHMWSATHRYPAAFPGVPALPTAAFTVEAAVQEALAEMDGAGVDASVLVVADFQARLGEPVLDIEQENAFVAEAHRAHPGRFIPFFGIDPRRPGAADAFERAIQAGGARGIKLHNAVGFYPHDRA